MRPLLTSEGRHRLEVLSRMRLLVALDFDGTLAPLQPRPESVGLSAQTRGLLRAVALRYPVAVVSGRSLADLAPRLAGCQVRWMVGNHGAEESDHGPSLEHHIKVARWRDMLEGKLREIHGAWLEDKGSSLSIHLRGARPSATASQVRRLLDPFDGMRVILGKRTVNLIPREAPHKGEAVLGLMERAGCERVLYVGDDVTDEDVFALAGHAPIEGVRVGRSRHSRAAWWVPRPGVDAMLAQLSSLRPSPETRPSAPTR